MKTNKPFVRIQSDKTIRVTPGLQHLDVTNPDAHVPDRLKISPSWPKSMVLIEAGAHVYPSEITEWPTVRALAKDKILTIGEYLDSPQDKAAEQAEVIESARELISPKKEIVEEKKNKLADIAGEDE